MLCGWLVKLVAILPRGARSLPPCLTDSADLLCIIYNFISAPDELWWGCKIMTTKRLRCVVLRSTWLKHKHGSGARVRRFKDPSSRVRDYVKLCRPGKNLYRKKSSRGLLWWGQTNTVVIVVAATTTAGTSLILGARIIFHASGAFRLSNTT